MIHSRKRVSLDFSKPSRTKQAHKDECDINNIIKRHRSAGIDLLRDGLVAKHFASEILDAPNFDFQESMNKVLVAQEAFEALPSYVRSRFSNDPASFVSFAINPANRDELIKLGLANPPVVTESNETPPANPSPRGNERSNKKPIAEGDSSGV